MSKRCIFIGIDGGDWQVLDPLVERGVMVNLGRLKEKGKSGVLNSTIPHLTGPAWSSFLTGVNPGKHGIFFWQDRWKPGKKRKLLTNEDIKTWQLPKVLNREGVSTGLLNCPFTYPVKRVDGFLISGMLSPKLDERSVYPVSLKKDLKKNNYILNTPAKVENKSYEEFSRDLDNLLKMAERRTDNFLKLDEKFNTDFTGLVYTAMDRVQHIFLKLILKDLNNNGDKKEKRKREGKNKKDWNLLNDKEKKLLQKIFKVYKKVDEGIGKIIKKAGAEDLILIASDHGFKPENKWVNLNKFFLKEKLLTPKTSTYILYPFYRISKSLGFFEPLKKTLGPLIGWKGRGHIPMTEILKKEGDRMQQINTKRSKVFSGKPSEQGVYLHPKLSKKEKRKLAGGIKKKLSRIRDSQTGEYIFKEIWRREEAYSGDQVEQACDVVFDLKDGYQLSTPIMLLNPAIEKGPFEYAGVHRGEGIYLCYSRGKGERMNSQRKEKKTAQGAERKIWDILPTVLGHFEKSIPEYMDGESLLK